MLPALTAPHTLAVGDLLIHPEALRLGRDRKRVLITEAGRTRPAGTTSEVLSVETERGVTHLRRMQTLDSRELGMIRVEVRMAPGTFAPLRAQSAGLLGASALSYDGGRVHGSVTAPDGVRAEVELLLTAPVFDAYSVEVVLRTLPLEAGYEVRIPAYVHRTRAVVAVTARVEGVDEHADETAWRVAVDFGRLSTTYWIGTGSRTIVRQDTPLSSGALLSFVR